MCKPSPCLTYLSKTSPRTAATNHIGDICSYPQTGIAWATRTHKGKRRKMESERENEQLNSFE